MSLCDITGEADVRLFSPHFFHDISTCLLHNSFLTMYYLSQLFCLPSSPSSLPPSLLSDGRGEWRGEVKRRSVGIITVWRTRMDLFAISVVGCCANLPSTNGTAANCRSTSWYQSKALNKQNHPLGDPCGAIFLSIVPSEQWIHAHAWQIKKTTTIHCTRAWVEGMGHSNTKFKN